MAVKTSAFLINFALVLSLLLIVTDVVHSRSIFGFQEKEVSSGLICESVIGVKKGDTCFEIANAFNLTSADFDAINPNLNCTSLFIGQWICTQGFEA